MTKKTLKYIVILAPFPVMVFSLFLGASDTITIKKIISFLFMHDTADAELIKTILYHVRLPRILLVFLTGGILAASGSAMQAIFRNPLVDPYILGLSSGAAFGAALALFISVIPIQISAFIFGLSAVGLSYIWPGKTSRYLLFH